DEQVARKHRHDPHARTAPNSHACPDARQKDVEALVFQVSLCPSFLARFAKDCSPQALVLHALPLSVASLSPCCRTQDTRGVGPLASLPERPAAVLRQSTLPPGLDPLQ